MKKKVMAIALAAATVSSMMGASVASAATDVAQSDLAYKGDLEIMHYSTSEESEGNGGSDGFPTLPLNPINPDNARTFRITAAAGTELAGPYS